MGVDYRAVIGVGQTFEDKYEAQSFLESHGVLSEEDLEQIEEDGLDEWGCNNDKVEVECLNLYSGDYYFVGYELNCSTPEAFKASFDNGMELWKDYFKNVEPDMVKTVKVY